MSSKPNFEKIKIPYKTQQNFFNPISNLTIAPPFPVYNIKQKEFTRPRPMRQYSRFIPTKKALSGMDPQGILTEFINKDIIKPIPLFMILKVLYINIIIYIRQG